MLLWSATACFDCLDKRWKRDCWGQTIVIIRPCFQVKKIKKRLKCENEFTSHREQAGVYKCQARNVHGEAEAELTIDVLFRPTCSVSQVSCLFNISISLLSILSLCHLDVISSPDQDVIKSTFKGAARSRNAPGVYSWGQSRGDYDSNHKKMLCHVILDQILS